MKIKTEHGMEASKAMDLPQTRESEIFLVYKSVGRGSGKRNKIENRSLDLDKKNRPPFGVPPGTTAYRATKHDLQGEKPSVKTEQDLSKVKPAISSKKIEDGEVKKTTTELINAIKLRTRSRSRSSSLRKK